MNGSCRTVANGRSRCHTTTANHKPPSRCAGLLAVAAFQPTFAAILSAEHLAIARRDVDLLGVTVMQAYRHQRAVRRHFVETLPGLTDVLAAVECAVFR